MPADPADATLIVLATYRLKPDDADSFATLALRMSAAAEGRDGCVFLKVARDVKDPTTFHLIESWRDQASLDAHGASEAFQTVMKEAAGLKIIGRSVDIYSVAGAKALAVPS